MYVTMYASVSELMVRKQLYITRAQDALLKRRARELGRTESELMRQAIESSWADPGMEAETAWAAELAFMKERSRLPWCGTGRNWTREELYEDRIGRISR